MKILGKKWVLIILSKLNNHKRFNELVGEIKGISARTLSKRLNELQKAKLINKKIFKEIPPRTEYRLTKSGRELTNCFSHLDKWAIKWSKEDEK